MTAPLLANFVLETATAPGTGATVNLAGAVAGRQSFAQAFASGSRVQYVIDDGTQAEWGEGTFTAGSPNTLTRTTLIGNTAGTSSLLNFTGSCRVYVDLLAERAVVRDSAGAVIITGALSANGSATVAGGLHVTDTGATVAGGLSVTSGNVLVSGALADGAGTRPPLLAADPAADLHAATKRYVDTQVATRQSAGDYAIVDQPNVFHGDQAFNDNVTFSKRRMFPGSAAHKFLSNGENYTVSAASDIVVLDSIASDLTVTVTLPLGQPGDRYSFLYIGANQLTVNLATAGGQAVKGAGASFGLHGATTGFLRQFLAFYDAAVTGGWAVAVF